MQTEEKKAKNKFVNFFCKIGSSVKEFFLNFVHRFKDGSIGTKLSHFIMGAGNLSHKQISKGLIYLFIELIFIAFIAFSPKINDTPLGAKAFVNLVTLGTNAGDIWTVCDNSMLMLLFGVITIGITVMFVFVYISNLKSSYKADLDVRKGKKPTTMKEDLKELFDSKFHTAMLTPAIIGIVVFTVLPTIFMILIAFTNYDSNHPAGTVLFDWVGLENFKNIFSGTSEISRFGDVLFWTLVWAFAATFTNYIGGILLALLINKKGIRLKKVWRTIFILTIAIPQFVSLLAIRQLLSEFGPFNRALMDLGIIDEPIKFLSTATATTKGAWTARITIIIINIWVGVPYTMLMTSGILMNVPKDLYEAATIDGAGKFKIFQKITLPYILYVTGPYLITSFIGNITSFNIIYLLSGGGPNYPGFKAGYTDLLVTWLYKLTIDEAEYNIGSVIAIVTFIIIATITLITYRRTKSYKQEDTFQ